MEQCKAITSSTGKQCTHPAMLGMNGYCGQHKHIYLDSPNPQPQIKKAKEEIVRIRLTTREKELLVRESNSKGFNHLCQYIYYRCFIYDVERERMLDILWGEVEKLKSEVFENKTKLKNIIGTSGFQLKEKRFCCDCGSILYVSNKGDFCKTCRDKRYQEFRARTDRADERKRAYDNEGKVSMFKAWTNNIKTKREYERQNQQRN